MSLRLATGERHASWLELFFDLVFVVAIAQLSAQLVEEPTFTGFLAFLGLYLPVWWGWVGFAIYCARFDFSEDWLFRVLMFAAMLSVAAMAVTLGAIETDSAWFALAYGFVRLDLVALYLLARRRVPEARELTTKFAIGFGIAAVIWFVSVPVATPYRYWLWALAMSIGVILTPLLSSPALRRTPVSTSHLPERFGLFMIIVLGESVLAVVIGTAHSEWQPTASAVAIAGFVCAAALWWNYFDFASRAVSSGLLRSVRSGTLSRNLYSWGHFPVAVGLTLLGAGVHLAIEDSSHGPLSTASRWVLFGGVALYLLAVCTITGLLERSLTRFAWPRLPATAVVVALGAVAGYLPTALAVWLLAATLVLQVMLEIALTRKEGRTAGAVSG